MKNKISPTKKIINSKKPEVGLIAKLIFVAIAVALVYIFVQGILNGCKAGEKRYFMGTSLPMCVPFGKTAYLTTDVFEFQTIIEANTQAIYKNLHIGAGNPRLENGENTMGLWISDNSDQDNKKANKVIRVKKGQNLFVGQEYTLTVLSVDQSSVTIGISPFIIE